MRRSAVLPAALAAAAATGTLLLLNGRAARSDEPLFDRTDYTVGTEPFAVAIADLNRDGKPDLVVANRSSHSVSVLLGNGTGGFGPKTDFPVPSIYPTGSRPESLVALDVDGDGDVDIVTANNDASISVLLGDGSGSFVAQPIQGTVATPFAIAAGDVDGDGDLDLVTANYAGNSITVFKNDGAGVFTEQAQISTAPGPAALALGDVNHDAKLDVVTGNLGSNTVSVLLGDGTGGFTRLTPDLDTGPNSGAVSIALADLARNGKLDIVTGNRDSSNVSFFSGNGDGTFGPRTDFATGATPRLAVADIVRDGKLDIVAASPGVVSIFPGDGHGGFAPKTDLVADQAARFVATGRLNRDGKIDFVVANGGNTAGATVYSPPGTTVSVYIQR